MPRTRRIVADETVYHIVQRGNNQQAIFKDEKDFNRFLFVLKKYITLYRFELYHYCLMSNHSHLLTKILEKETLSKAMQGIFQTYRFYYKLKYGYIGYLYQGRYKSKLIEKDSYLIECGRYIERNPVRAMLVEKPWDYMSSSCIYYAYSGKSDTITENPLYADFGRTKRERQARYKEYVSTARAYEEIIDKEFRIL